MEPKPPFRSTTEELLYAILHKLPNANYLKVDDLNTLAKLNALLTDADLAPAQTVQASIDQLKGNVPAVADSLEKLYGIIQGLAFLKAEDIDTLAELNAILIDADLLRGGDIRFSNVLFISPTGDNEHGVKGDISRPFLPSGIVSKAVLGDKVVFLPGNYTIAQNIAVNGVEYSTLGSSVSITVSQADTILFDFSTIQDSDLPIHIGGDFDFHIEASAGGIFKFNNNGGKKRRYEVHWRTAYQAGGIFLTMPIAFTTGLFSGNIDVAPTAQAPCIRCDPNGCSGIGKLSAIIHNASSSTSAIAPNFNGFEIDINYSATAKGLFAQPTGSVLGSNHYTLGIVQPVNAITYITSGEYDVSVSGGSLMVMNKSKVIMKSTMSNCTFHVARDTDTVVNAIANTVNIINDQVTLLVLDGIWRDCSYSRTTLSPIILKGQFFNLTFQGSPGLMTITGRVELSIGNVIACNVNGEFIDIQGTLIGNAPVIILYSFDCKVLISGQVKNLKSDGLIVNTDRRGGTYTLVLRGAVLEAGNTSLQTVNVLAGDTLVITIYGRSFFNRPVVATGSIVYKVGTQDDIIVNADVKAVPKIFFL